MALFAEADIKLSTSKRTLLTQSSNFPIEVLFLRDDDIPQSVASGVADIFRKQMGGHPRAWIFTSATLAVQRSFTHYCAEMGLYDAETACWDSPFDYGAQAMLYAPLGMPDPNSHGYAEAVVKAERERLAEVSKQLVKIAEQQAAIAAM
jgi:Rad3-related DNA helicase